MANKKFGLAFILSHFIKNVLPLNASGQRDQRDDCVDMAYNFFSFKTLKMYYPSTQLLRRASGQRDDCVDMAYHFFLI